jgi:hypothetical protein
MKPGMKNALVIGAILLAALGLIAAARFLNPGAERSQEEIKQQIEQLAQASPAPTASPGEGQSGTPEKAPEKAPEAEAYMYIIVNGRISGIYAVGEEGDVTVDQGDGKVNVIHMTEKGFYMASSTCDNQLCVHQGEVTIDNYQQRILGASVLCLPNNVDLELVVPSHTPDPNAPDI